jgi:hypothetical protein
MTAVRAILLVKNCFREPLLFDVVRPIVLKNTVNDGAMKPVGPVGESWHDGKPG